MLLENNEKLTFVEGSVRRSVGSSLVEAAVARDSRGGLAARFAAVAQLGPVNVSADALIANDFVVNGEREKRYREGRSRSTHRSSSAARPSPLMATSG